MNDITIIIPALNEEKYLPRLLHGLAEQTRRDFGVVVVDGSSQDQTVALARSFGDRLAGLRVIVSPRKGVPLQRNLGARASRGEWLVFLDADATVQPYFIERFERFMAERQPQFFTAWSGPDGDAAGEAVFTLLVNAYVEGSVMAGRPLAPGALMVMQRDLFDQAGGFDETLTFGEDYDLTQRLTALGARLQILRETVHAYSLRRMRKEGKPRFIWFYAKATLVTLLTRRALRAAPGYVLGGQFFETLPPQPKS